MAGPTDADILEIGRSIRDALPAASRSPLKALDAKAMDLATADADLRAALFRFVDVVPACRSVDDVVAHLSGFLDEVDERPPPLDAAMRMGSSRAGRQALGRAAAAGVRHMAHRFIVGESAHDADPHADRPLARRHRVVRRPARRGDRHPRRGRSATPRAARTSSRC